MTGPSDICLCGHAKRLHRQGDISKDRRSCMALGFHTGVPGYASSECYAFEPDTSVLVIRRDKTGRFQRVAP